jgi:cytochrome c-type biogenesis protein CcmH
MSRWLSWAAMALVLVGTLLVGVTEDRAPRTEADRVNAIAAELQCPTCQGLSAAESDAAAAQAVREEIRTRLRAGQSKGEIQRYFVSRFGPGILLKPEATGVAGLVWVLPVAGGILAAAALVLTFRRWRREIAAAPAPSDADRALVDQALRSP